jgi:hypothetical protein
MLVPKAHEDPVRRVPLLPGSVQIQDQPAVDDAAKCICEYDRSASGPLPGRGKGIGDRLSDHPAMDLMLLGQTSDTLAVKEVLLPDKLKKLHLGHLVTTSDRRSPVNFNVPEVVPRVGPN